MTKSEASIIKPLRVKSPCINVCKVQDNLCVGCSRTTAEIATWRDMTDNQRLKVLERIKQLTTSTV